jgi:hypothetical protein
MCDKAAHQALAEAGCSWRCLCRCVSCSARSRSRASRSRWCASRASRCASLALSRASRARWRASCLLARSRSRCSRAASLRLARERGLPSARSASRPVWRVRARDTARRSAARFSSVAVRVASRTSRWCWRRASSAVLVAASSCCSWALRSLRSLVALTLASSALSSFSSARGVALAFDCVCSVRARWLGGLAWCCGLSPKNSAAATAAPSMTLTPITVRRLMPPSSTSQPTPAGARGGRVRAPVRAARTLALGRLQVGSRLRACEL